MIVLTYKKNSFTLIEILVVVTIIGFLASTGIVAYKSLINNSLDAKRKSDIGEIRVALEMYRSKYSYYPSNLNSLVVEKLLKKIPKDPKTNEDYLYEPSPYNCGFPANRCTSYKITTILSDGTTYEVDPYGSSQ